MDDLEVSHRVRVPDKERAQPQRHVLTPDLDSDFSAAAVSDRIEDTINYKTISDALLKFGDSRDWKLIEKLAADIADMVLNRYRPSSVRVEVKKFVIPQARYIAVALER